MEQSRSGCFRSDTRGRRGWEFLRKESILTLEALYGSWGGWEEVALSFNVKMNPRGIVAMLFILPYLLNENIPT